MLALRVLGKNLSRYLPQFLGPQMVLGLSLHSINLPTAFSSISSQLPPVCVQISWRRSHCTRAHLHELIVMWLPRWRPDLLIRSPSKALGCLILICCCRLVAQPCLTLLNLVDCSPTRLLCPWDFPGKNTGVGCHFLLQRIFMAQGSNLGLLHWQPNSLPLSHQGEYNGVL